MRVVIDGLPLLGEASIATYLRELVLHLATEGAEHEYRLFFRGFRAAIRQRMARLAAESTFSRFPMSVTRIPDRVLELCWTSGSLHLPLTELCLRHPDLFLSTIHLTPVLKRAAVVSIAYDLIPMRFPSFYAADQPLLETRLRRTIERSNAIIAISECTKRDYVELLGADPARIHVIYPGIDSRFGPKTDEVARERVLVAHAIHRPYLLYVGSLGPHKNVGTLVRVFRQVKRHRHIPHQLVLCGRVAWGQDVVREASDLVTAGECMILDFVPASDIPYLYHGADGFCFLSLYEGFGLPPAEALACGVPTLVSNAGSLPEVVGDAALMVPPHDEAAAADALWRLVSDETLRDSLRLRGPRQAARFHWAEAARHTLKVFQLAREMP